MDEMGRERSPPPLPLADILHCPLLFLSYIAFALLLHFRLLLLNLFLFPFVITHCCMLLQCLSGVFLFLKHKHKYMYQGGNRGCFAMYRLSLNSIHMQ